MYMITIISFFADALRIGEKPCNESTI